MSLIPRFAERHFSCDLMFLPWSPHPPAAWRPELEDPGLIAVPLNGIVPASKYEPVISA